MKREEVESYLVSIGWIRDRWGHYRNGAYRIRLQSKTVRYEVAGTNGGWVRLRSAYYGKLSIRHDILIVDAGENEWKFFRGVK